MGLSDETRKEIDAALRRYPEKRTAVLDALRAAQAERGYLGAETVREVAEWLRLEPALRELGEILANMGI